MPKDKTNPDKSRGKNYRNAVASYDRETLHTTADAVAKVKSLAKAKFDETVELSVRLGLDPRKTEQSVRGTVSMPSGTGKSVRIAVFAAGEAAKQAREAGADIVGSDDLAAEMKKQNGFRHRNCYTRHDATSWQVGSSSGPRGLMPNPKTGTVTTDVARAVGEFKGGKVEFRTDRYGNVHIPVGKVSFEASALALNVTAVLDELNRTRPAAAKGRYIKKVSVSSTMGPGVKIDPALVSGE